MPTKFMSYTFIDQNYAKLMLNKIATRVESGIYLTLAVIMLAIETNFCYYMNLTS